MTTTPDTKKLAEDIAIFMAMSSHNAPTMRSIITNLLTLMGEMREALEATPRLSWGGRFALARTEPLKHLMEEK